MREVILASFLNLLFYAALIAVTTVAPESAEFNSQAFGEKPFGFPVAGFVFVLLSVLYLPFVPAVCGLARLKIIDLDRRKAVGQGNNLYADRLKEMGPPAWRLCKFGLVYLLVLFCLWIANTTYMDV